MKLYTKITPIFIFFVHKIFGDAANKKYYGNLAFYGRGQSELAKYWNNIDEIKYSENVKIYFPHNETTIQNQPLVMFLPGKKKNPYSKIEFHILFKYNTGISLNQYHKIKTEMKVVPPPLDELISEGYTCESIGLPCDNITDYNFDSKPSEWLSYVDLQLYLEASDGDKRQNLNDIDNTNYSYKIENFTSPSQQWNECTGDIVYTHFNNTQNLSINYNSFVFKNYGTMPIYLLLGNTMFLKKEPTFMIKQGKFQNYFSDWSWNEESRGSETTYFNNTIYSKDSQNNECLVFKSNELDEYAISGHIVNGISAPPEAISLRIRLMRKSNFQGNFQLKIKNNGNYNLNELFFHPRNCKIPVGEEVELLIDTRSLYSTDPKNMINNDVKGYWFRKITNINDIRDKILKLYSQNREDDYHELFYLYDFIIHHTFPNSTSSYIKSNLNKDGPDCNIELQTHQDWINSQIIKQWPDDISFEDIHQLYNIDTLDNSNPYKEYIGINKLYNMNNI